MGKGAENRFPLGPVGFPSLRRHAVLLWRPSGHEGLELDRIDGFARRQPSIVTPMAAAWLWPKTTVRMFLPK